MGLPASMTNDAMSTIEGALSTGARGSQTITQDYSQLSNAFMQKAQLDINIAEMQSSNMNQAAQLYSNVELKKADIMMQGANMKMQAAMYEDQVRREEEANKLSPFEQITGVLAGAASGAAAGAAFGPQGAIIGGVAGGALTLGAGKDRRRQQNTIGNINTIASATSLIKGGLDAKKGSDSYSTWNKGFETLSALARKEQPGSPEHEAAMMNLNNHIDSFGEVGRLNGMNPQVVAQTQGSMRDQSMNGFDPSKPEHVASRNINKILHDAEANPVFTDPNQKGHKAAVQKVMGDISKEYSVGFKGAITPSQLHGMLDSASGDVPIGSNYFGSKGGGSPAAPQRRIDSMPNQTRSDSGVNSVRQPMQYEHDSGSTTVSGSGAYQARPPGADATRMAPGMGVMAPSAATAAWGVEMDSPEAMMDGISKMSNEAAKDPEIALKALGKEPQMEPPSDDARERERWNKNPIGDMMIDDDVITDERKGRAEKYKTEKAAYDEKKRAAFGDVDLTKPNITSDDPREAVFKTAKDPTKIIKEFGLAGKYEGAAAKDMSFHPKAAAELNNLVGEINDPTIKDMSPDQRLQFMTWLQGNGEGAMKGGSGTVGGKGAGLSYSEFERSIKVQYEGAGVRDQLTSAQTKALYKVYTHINPVSRMIAMQFNKGTLTAQDVEGFNSGLMNMFESDPEINMEGTNTIRDLLWRSFQTDLEMTPTISGKAGAEMAKFHEREATKNRYKQQQKMNDEAGHY